ncbi:MAG: tRNA (adenosine(37)-N6)-threonylcarbamoyltransferase complex dimerization subunit type 1 TsaB [Aerococcus sp.]|nr:tRNA (adenosine(37)-N6)-threonylcarbamoyltransferase complex dimerization subunit type 1 TsaB [Aerococcus sp.]
MKILALDTSTQAMSIALMVATDDLKTAVLKAETTTNTKIKHSTQLLPLVNQLLMTIGWEASQLEAIVVTRGPGSYTGLRIGVTFAKTLAWTLQIPLYSLSSLEALIGNSHCQEGVAFTFINARRQTLFGAGYQLANGTIAKQILTSQYYTLAEYLDQIEIVLEQEQVDAHAPLYFISPDYEVFQSGIRERFNDRAVILTGERTLIRASQMVKLPLKVEDVATFIPEYLKRAEAEEHWQALHQEEAKRDGGHYVERAD